MHMGEKMAELFGIAKRCPFHEPAPDCPLADVRTQSLKERHQTLTALSPSDIDQVLRFHSNCSCRRGNG